MPIEGYNFTRDDLPMLLKFGYFPEQPPDESALLKDWLVEHGAEYDRYSFSARVGQGQTPAPDLDPGVARSVAFSTRKRIDALAWQGVALTILEAKIRVKAAMLGQILMYRQLVLEEFPDLEEPRLVAIGRYSDDDTLRVLAAHNIDVLLYERPLVV